MSEHHKIASRAIHKANQAISDIQTVKQTLYRDAVGKVTLGFIVLIVTLIYDFLAPLFEAQYAPGFGREQIFITLFAIFLILWGMKGLNK